MFVSIGRKLNTDIGPIAELIEFEGRAIKVDEHMRTNVEEVYAHPTRSETIMEAVKDIFGESIHKV